MKTSCMQEDLARRLSTVRPAVASKSVLPALTHILFDARDQSLGEGRVKLAATNLDLTITTWLPGRIEDAGAIALPARVIADFVNTLPPERVELTLNAATQTMRVRCGRYNANINGIAAQEFPDTTPLVNPSIQIALDPRGLREMLDRVVFAAATEQSRPVLNGALVKFEANRLTLAAADGFRLSLQHTGISEALAAEPFSLVIPVKALQELGRLCADQVEPVKFAVVPNKNQVRFTLTTSEVIAQLIDGAFPDVTRIIPQEHTSRAVMNVAELECAAKMVSAFVDKYGKSNGIRLEADPVNSRVIVMGAHAERGDGVGDVDATIEGEAFRIGLQAPYLLAMLERVTAPQLAIEYLKNGGDPMPVVVRPVGDDDFVHVMMPLVDVKPRPQPDKPTAQS